jgi:hypothetical protein
MKGYILGTSISSSTWDRNIGGDLDQMLDVGIRTK